MQLPKLPMYNEDFSTPTGINPVRVQSLSPMVYKYKKKKGEKDKEDSIYLAEDRPSFKSPPKYYGDTLEKSRYMFTYFNNTPGSTGIMLVGEAGSGKTLMAETICNLGIENNLPVIYVAGVSISKHDIQFLSTLNNCIVLMDEYSKLFPYYEQKFFLSLLTDKDKKILWILTDNNTADFNSFILSRPGRVRYRLRFGKLDRKVFEGYIKDHKLSPLFEEELRDVYNAADKFTFDHLESIVAEHKFCPTLGIKEMIEIMNIDNLDTRAIITVARIEYLGKEIPMAFTHPDGKLDNNFIPSEININLVGSKVPFKEVKYGDIVDTYVYSSDLGVLYKPLNPEFNVRIERSNNHRTFSSRGVFNVLIKEPSRLKVKLLPSIRFLKEEDKTALGDEYAYIEDLDENTLNERLRIDPYSIGSRHQNLEPLRKVLTSKDKSKAYEDLVGVEGGFKDPKGGYLLHYKNSYFSIYFNITKVEGMEPIIIDKLL